MESRKKAIVQTGPHFAAQKLDLTSPPAPNARIAINNLGQIVGTIGAPGFEQAFLWQPETKKSYDLPTADGCTSYAVDINTDGDITGYMMDIAGNMAQVIWRPKEKNCPPQRLPTMMNSNRKNSIPPGQLSAYGGINDLCWVGSDEFDFDGNSVRATVFPGKKPIIELSTDFWGARAINNCLDVKPTDPRFKQFQIVGHGSAPYPNGAQPVRWFPDVKSPWKSGRYSHFLSVATRFDLLQSAAATDVNDFGAAVVAGNLPGQSFSPVIVWNPDDTCVDLSPKLSALRVIPLASSSNYPLGINNSGWIVGTLDTSLAFLCAPIPAPEPGKFSANYNAYDLSLSCDPQDVTLGVANDINDQYQIVATGNLDGCAGVILLTMTRPYQLG